MPELCQSQGVPGRAARQVPVSYGVTILTGVLASCFFDVIYQRNWSPGRLIYYAYQLFLGPFADFWRFHVTVLFLPLLVVNLLNYALYRQSQFVLERVFFLVLSVLLNGLVLFAGMNVLIGRFV